ncbi:hypothetical protein BDY24DRAFT_393400 [Mrakia frigida]|uniref:uncharacterized protein n=1 Tax=Mrakia frigida TaxID=29902 RepID=UPI003FCC23AC
MRASPDDPRSGSPPQPTEHLILVPVLAIITLCILFILWRRADAMKGAVAYRLKNRTLRGPGTIRLGDEERHDEDHGDLTDDDLSEDEAQGGRSSNPSRPILPPPTLPHLHLTPPTPAADPSAIFELGGEEEVDAVELPARVGTEEVVEGIKELEEVQEREEEAREEEGAKGGKGKGRGKGGKGGKKRKGSGS